LDEVAHISPALIQPEFVAILSPGYPRRKSLLVAEERDKVN
jgi:hypothetical protein